MIAKDLLKNINVKKPKNLKGDVFKEAQSVLSTVDVGDERSLISRVSMLRLSTKPLSWCRQRPVLYCDSD